MEDISRYLKDAQLYYKEAFSRNIGLLSWPEQERLRQARVGIVGVGGVGGFHLVTLTRLGIGKFSIADPEAYELANIQRQCGAFIDTCGQGKAEVMRKTALSINPHLEIKAIGAGISQENIDDFFAGVEVMIDGIDFFSIEERRMIFREARKRKIYAVTAGPLGFGCALLIFSPNGMSFDEYFDLRDNMSYEEKIIAFGIGLAPAALQLDYLKLSTVNLKAKSGPSLVSACNLCSVMAATEVVKILLKRKAPKPAPFYVQFDPYVQKLKRGYLLWGNRNPVQRVKRWYLSRKLVSRS